MQENKMEKKENPAQDVQDFQPMSEDRAYLCKTVHNLVMVMSTLGVSNILIKKSKGTNKTKIKNKKVCLCQNCGYDWVIK